MLFSTPNQLMGKDSMMISEGRNDKEMTTIIPKEK